jgi:hypothetical protein
MNNDTMPRRNLTAILVGADEDQGDVRLADFCDFCGSLTRCLRRVETKFADGVTTRLRYRIVNLARSSASLTVEPIAPAQGRDFGPDVLDLFTETIRNLQGGKTVDPRFANDDLEAFRTLARPIHRQVREIRIADTKVTTRFIANIDELIGALVPSAGSVKGRLERLNLHNRCEFVIYPPISGYSVRCTFTDDLFDKIHEAIRRNVTVYGTLHFRPGRPFPDQVEVKSIEIHPPDEELPKLADLRGTWKGSTGDLGVVDSIQANRDE